MAVSLSNIGNMTTTVATNVTIPSMSGGTSGRRRSVAEIVILSMVIILLILLSFFGNLLVVICIRWNRRLSQETGNIFLVNLSITDMANAVIVMTSTLPALTMDGWYLPIVWCHIVCVMNYVLIIVSMLTLCFIALDRYAAMVHALTYETLVTKRKVLLLISFAWFQGLAFGITPSLLKWIHYDYWEMVCAINWGGDSNRTLIYVVLAFTLCFFLPGAILAACYCKIMKMAKGISSMIPQRPTGTFVQSTNSLRDMTCTNKISDSNLIASSRETSDGEVVQERQNGEEKAKEEKGKKVGIHLTLAESVCAVSMNSVCTTQKPEEVTHAGCLSGVDSLQRDPPQDKSPGLTLFTKICPIRCFGFAVNKEDPSGESSEKKASVASGMRRHQSLSVPRRSQAYSSSNKAINSLLIVVVAFFICMTPFCITKLYKVIESSQNALPGPINAIATIFQFCSSAINPLIYSIFRKDFRYVFRSWFRRVCFRSTTNSSFTEGDTFSY